MYLHVNNLMLYNLFAVKNICVKWHNQSSQYHFGIKIKVQEFYSNYNTRISRLSIA